MNCIGVNEALIELLGSDFNLLSSKMYKIEIQESDVESLLVNLYFKLLYAKEGKLIMLRFSEIEEFSFYHNRSHYFYNVESYKLLKIESGFYISLDPFMENNIDKVSSNDQDFIMCGRMEGFIL